MNSKKKLIQTICFITVIIVGGLIWWEAPSSLINITPEKVSKIEFSNGRTGERITITDSTKIEHIIENLNAVSIKKRKISLFYMGTYLKTTIYKTNGKIYKEFIINSGYTIRKDPFFYRDITESIDYNYLQELFNDNSK